MLFCSRQNLNAFDFFISDMCERVAALFSVFTPGPSGGKPAEMSVGQ